MSSRPLTDDEFRHLGNGLKFGPTPKPYDVIKLAEETFNFSRRLRLKEFFAPGPEEDETNDLDNESDEIPKVKKEQSSFVPLAGRDSTLDFHIEAYTHYIFTEYCGRRLIRGLRGLNKTRHHMG